MVCGRYVDKIENASHVLFDGHLDDPGFRVVAIQKIVNVDGRKITLDTSGELEIRKRNGRFFVPLSYKGFFGNMEKTKGSFFKDDNTPAWGAK